MDITEIMMLTLNAFLLLDQILYYYVDKGYSLQDLLDLKFNLETVKWFIQAVDRNDYKGKLLLD